MPRDTTIKKTLVIGSGPIVIGQAAEFDYAGTQACRILREEGVEIVLVNSNPATIMTDRDMADKIYLEPLTPATLKRIIEKEQPDSLLANMGGQTGLTLAMQLEKEGFLQRKGVRLLGTNLDAIERAEDRRLFKETMESVGQPVIPSGIADDYETAKEIVAEIGYPVVIRPAFTLGGAGGGVAHDNAEFEAAAKTGLLTSPIHQILVEKYIYGWKEIEYEAIRDGAGNAAAVCSMENVDPVGIHTGDSVVVAPALTLAEKDLQMLRRAALDIISALGIAGGCNVQFALSPDSSDYFVIEVNPRVSRSSALASKATGYPIAKIATKIALGYRLDEIKGEGGERSLLGFEPAPDYVVVKFPRFPFDKFAGATHTLGTQMKATGEVMAIGRSFEAALMKAVRGAEISRDTLHFDGEISEESLSLDDDLRLFRIFAALKSGASVESLYEKTKVDRWFLEKLQSLALFELSITGKLLTGEEYKRAKKCGYTDSALSRITGNPLPQNLLPSYKTVDTCSAVFGATSPYFYSVFGEECESRPLARKDCVVVLGSGPIRIGQGIEFDYSSVHCVETLKKLGYEVVVINNNPETVSTDFDISDRLYFEPLTEEDVLPIIKIEQPVGVVAAFGGQTAIKLTKALLDNGISILGTPYDSIDLTEDRGRFEALLESLTIARPAGKGVHFADEAVEIAKQLGYPVLVRPSYVIGGQNMTVAYADEDILRFVSRIRAEDKESPILIDKFLLGTELEVDVIFDGTDVLIPGVMEHIERAGVHSGDSIAVYPSFNLPDSILAAVIDCTRKLAVAVGARGLLNIQYLIHDNQLFVIEVNPRASRTVPYISKVTGLPVVDIAVRVMMGATLASLGYATGLYRTPPYCAVKVPVFSYEKLSDADFSLGPQMKSTGEVLGIGKNVNEAMFKGLIAAGYHLPGHTEAKGLFVTVNDQDKFEIANLIKKFQDIGFSVYATPGTAKELEGLGEKIIIVDKLDSSDSIFTLIESGKIGYIIYTANGRTEEINDFISIQQCALRHSIACFSSIDTANALADILLSRFNESNTELVDLNNMRSERQSLTFAKMQGTSDDYIFFENFDGSITAPESLALTLSDRRTGIGGTGVVLIERSDIADAKMRIFNGDGSEGAMAGNSIRSVGKYLWDNNIAKKEKMTIETKSGVRTLYLYPTGGEIRTVSVNMGKTEFDPRKIPVLLEGERIVNRPVTIANKIYDITCLSIGNPHCVVFVDRVDDVNVPAIGPLFEHNPVFPERVNTEFVRVVNRRMLKMRVWERGNGETYACGTGACAAAVAAVENGHCDKGADITVKLKGGDLIVNYTDERVLLTGDTNLVYTGIVSI